MGKVCDGGLEINISVCIPVRNAEWCLLDCFRTLKSQTVQPLEYIFCVGPSNDRTEELIKKFQKQNQTPIHIIYDIDGKGTTYASQLMFEKAKGEYVLWASSDAIFPVNWIEIQQQIIKDHNDVDMIAANPIEIPEKQAQKMRKKNIFPEKINISTLKLNKGIKHTCSIIKRETMLKRGGFDLFFVRGQDRDLVLRFKILGCKGLWSKDLKYLHTGLIGRYSKVLNRATFPRFIYKYGLKYIIHEREHFVGFLLRFSFLLSVLLIIPLHLINLTSFGLLWLILSSICLLGGVTLKHGVNLSIYLIQIGKCFGEVYMFYKILTDNSEKSYGYGKSLWEKEK